MPSDAWKILHKNEVEGLSELEEIVTENKNSVTGLTAKIAEVEGKLCDVDCKELQKDINENKTKITHLDARVTALESGGGGGTPTPPTPASGYIVDLKGHSTGADMVSSTYWGDDADGYIDWAGIGTGEIGGFTVEGTTLEYPYGLHTTRKGKINFTMQGQVKWSDLDASDNPMWGELELYVLQGDKWTLHENLGRSETVSIPKNTSVKSQDVSIEFHIPADLPVVVTGDKKVKIKLRLVAKIQNVGSYGGTHMHKARAYTIPGEQFIKFSFALNEENHWELCEGEEFVKPTKDLPVRAMDFVLDENGKSTKEALADCDARISALESGGGGGETPPCMVYRGRISNHMDLPEGSKEALGHFYIVDGGEPGNSGTPLNGIYMCIEGGTDQWGNPFYFYGWIASTLGANQHIDLMQRDIAALKGEIKALKEGVARSVGKP